MVFKAGSHFHAQISGKTVINVSQVTRKPFLGVCAILDIHVDTYLVENNKGADQPV